MVNSLYPALIRGIGSFVPAGRLSNFDLEKMVKTSDEWIVTRTGISERGIAAAHEATSDIAYEAAKEAIINAGLTPADIDAIIVGTCTPDYQFPSVASQIQYRLGCPHITSFDVANACVGFVSCLEIANQFIQTGLKKNILVVGADTMSRITDYSDRGTCILFSDGAGACVLSRAEDPNHKGIICTQTHTDGELLTSLYVPGGGSRHPEPKYPETKDKIVMEGNKIFKVAVTVMTQTIEANLRSIGYTKEDIDWLIPHQANIRIMSAIAHNLDFPLEKVINNIRFFGNNSSATIPLALHAAIRDGKIQRGQKLMLTAFGGGLVWGSIFMEY
ncbi:MAG: beta-ketoacyl-ACP synthase III [Bacteroidota bacterium]